MTGKQANTHRLHWLTFDKDTGTRSAAKLDFPSAEAAHAHKRDLMAANPEVVATITPIVPKARPLRREKIGDGHPEYQGKPRMTR